MSHEPSPFETPSEITPGEPDAREAETLRGPRNVMVALTCLGLFGTCFLISAGTGTEAGHQPWKPGSVLRLLTTLLNLTGQYPTPHGTEVKWLAQGLAASAALVAAGYAFWLRTRREGDASDDFDAEDTDRNHPRQEPLRDRLSRIPLVTAAQIAMGVFVAYMALSSLWSPWAEGSFGDSMIRVTAVVWAICLGRILNPRKAPSAIIALILILALMSALGVWYYFERAPLQRLKFPIGNPIFLAAMLLPGLILAGAILAAGISSRFSRKPTTGPTRPPAPVAAHPVLIVGSVIALIVIFWAMVLADSRGPAVGLMGALFICLLIAVPKGARRWVLGLTLIAAAVIMMTGAWPMTWLQSRPTTLRVRLYAWSYARDLFYARPDIGHGQGSYVLMAQAPSRADALQDPEAFTTGLLGHAHSEWLEILADLGAIGFALIATSLALTLYAAIVAMRRHTKHTFPWWMILGLAGALLALIFEECFNVGLRMAGLPFVFHTILGLLWAMSRTVDDAPSPQDVTPLLRVGTTLLLCLGAVAILMVSVANWQAARAEYQLNQTIAHQRWDDVAMATNRAAEFRWPIEERMKSLETVAWAYHVTAQHHGFQLITMLNRRSSGADSAESARISAIAAEDLQLFASYADAEKHLIGFMVETMPRYPDVAWLAAETCFLQQEIAGELARYQGVSSDVNFLPEAARWLEVELGSDRYDADVALRLVQLAPQVPMAQRLDWLRVPLRVSTLTPDYERVLAALIQQPDFGAMMNEWIRVAQATTQPAGSHPLPPDAYAPETLRLSSAALKLSGRFDDAARHAGLAVELYAPLRGRFPSAVAFSRLEQARCLFLARPDRPQVAVETCRRGLQETGHLPDDSRRLLQRSLALYLAAAGQEAEARSYLHQADPQLNEQQLDFEIARACVELSSLVMGLGPDRQPPELSDWLRRAVELAPQWAPPHQLAFNRAIERGDTDTALRHFEQLRHIVTDPQLWAEWMSAIQSRYQGNATLQDVFNRAPSTQPAEPATQPAGPLTRPAPPGDIDPLVPLRESPGESSGNSIIGEKTPLQTR